MTDIELDILNHRIALAGARMEQVAERDGLAAARPHMEKMYRLIRVRNAELIARNPERGCYFAEAGERHGVEIRVQGASQ